MACRLFQNRACSGSRFANNHRLLRHHCQGNPFALGKRVIGRHNRHQMVLPEYPAGKIGMIRRPFGKSKMQRSIKQSLLYFGGVGDPDG